MKMKNIFWMILMTGLLGGANCPAQSLPPKDLMQAMHCITSNHGGWLTPPLSRQKQWPASVARERMGYPHEDHMVVVVYENASRGQMFDLSAHINAGKWRYKIENNGTFNLDKGHIDFVNSPMSSAWPPGRLEAFVREALRAERFMLRASMLGPASRLVTCSSYATDQ